jgi:hypothetical protein
MSSPAWNWKTALWSGLYRSPAFFIAAAKSGWGPAVRASLVEFLLFASIAGVTGALTQRCRKVRPHWLSALLILGAMPLLIHTAEFLVHTLAGTPNRKTGVLISAGMTAIGVTFNWYCMHHGAFLAGEEGKPFVHDVKRIPQLLMGFITLPVRALGKAVRETR